MFYKSIGAASVFFAGVLFVGVVQCVIKDDAAIAVLAALVDIWFLVGGMLLIVKETK
jgi:hypothetical protein